MQIKLYKLQKTFTFVPFLNYLVFFLWAWNQIEAKHYFSLFKRVIIAIATIAPILALLTLWQGLYDAFFENVPLFVWILYYLRGLSVSIPCLLSQKAMLHFYKQREDYNRE